MDNLKSELEKYKADGHTLLSIDLMIRLVELYAQQHKQEGLNSDGFAIQVNKEERWYPSECENCGWIGSSELLNGGHAIADTGDFSDPLCPVCGSNKVDETDDVIPLKRFPALYQKAITLLKQYVSANYQQADKIYELQLTSLSPQQSADAVELFYCKEWNNVGYVCEDGQCDACKKAENMPDFEYKELQQSTPSESAKEIERLKGLLDKVLACMCLERVERFDIIHEIKAALTNK